jgi:hypothetical protein
MAKKLEKPRPKTPMPFKEKRSRGIQRRYKIMIVGAILLAIGIIFLVAGIDVGSNYETYEGQLKLLTDPTAQKNYQVSLVMKWGGGFMMVLGVVMLILGFFLPEKKMKYTQYSCRNCGRQLMFIEPEQKWYCSQCRLYA